MLVASYRITALSCIAWMAASAGCTAPDDDALGSVTVNLLGQTPSGNVYRLRDAVITVQGPTSTRVWSTEDDPDRTSLSADVAIGDYSATLRDGWRIERVDGASTTTLPAQLVSNNPVLFTVDLDQRTSVPLRFRVGSEDVDLTQGYDITLVVDEPPPPLLFVASQILTSFPGAIEVFPANASGDVAPLRAIAGRSAELVNPGGIAIAGDQLIVTDGGRVAVVFYPLGGNGDIAPTKQIIGLNTGMSFPTGVVVLDDEIYVLNAGGSITVFPLTATGNALPTRVITFPSNVVGFAIDNGEIYVTTGSFGGTILVYPITATGAATPTRTIQLQCPGSIAIRRGEIFVYDFCIPGILAFAKTTNGPVQQARQLAGPNTGLTNVGRFSVSQGRIYAPEHTSGTIRVFPANASGDVAPTEVLGGPDTRLGFPHTAFVF